MTIYHHVKNFSKKNVPSLINIRTCREYWHEGAGKDKEEKGFWSRYKIVKKKLINIGEENFIKNIEIKNKRWSKNLWEKQLQKL